ncbi:late competence protein ComER [Ectobacillus ponti]|uniref:Pyrroline-5-carboxylate reductase n=1 Tax=Ectobacillus ponti TaxID=2961894 RepID=A0AA41X1F5_9BACI|nr:late competence protein ComER [Ectobacillus ponti]
MNVGMIGTGNMGRILIDAFIEADALTPSCLTIINRTAAKAHSIRDRYPSITVGETIEEVIQQSDLIFLCVKPLQIQPILQQYGACLTREKCLVSITSPITTSQLEQSVSCNVTRVIPSITNRALSGVSLCTFGKHCTAEWQERVMTLFQAISTPLIIDESITRVSSDIVSCGPAFFSYLLQRFINAAVAETKITREDATALATGMIIGMGKLLEKEVFTLPTLQEKVCVKGGITGEGIAVLEEETGDMFEHLLQRTHAKFREDVEQINEQFKHS